MVPGGTGSDGVVSIKWTAPTSVTPPPSGVGCKSGEILPGGDSCSVQCISGETITKQGSFDYSCSPTGLVAPTAQCGSVVKCPSPDAKLSPCLVPAFTNGTRGGSSGPCKPGTYLQSGDICTIQCVAGYNTNSGTSQYHCANGTMDKTPGLQCTPPEGCTVKSLGPGVMAASKNGCIVPETLSTGLSFGNPCTVDIPAAYTGCTASLDVGSSCTVGCSPGYVPDNSGSNTYTCSLPGGLTISPGKNGGGSLKCVKPKACTVNLPTGYTGCGTTLAAGTSCKASCSSNYTSAGDSMTYTCPATGGVALTGVGNLTCTAPSCPISPTALSAGCETVAANDSCPYTCVSGYEGGGTYTCSADGTLSGGGGCTAIPPCPISPTSNTVGCESTLATNDTCPYTCANGYEGGGTYTCSADGTLSGGGGCTAMPACVNPATSSTGMSSLAYSLGEAAPRSNGWSMMNTSEGAKYMPGGAPCGSGSFWGYGCCGAGPWGDSKHQGQQQWLGSPGNCEFLPCPQGYKYSAAVSQDEYSSNLPDCGCKLDI
jgi:hypothetical protein